MQERSRMMREIFAAELAKEVVRPRNQMSETMDAVPDERVI